MNNYIDLWTGWHVALATWLFLLCWRVLKNKVYNVLFYSFGITIALALLYELSEFVWNVGAYPSMERHLVNAFFDMVAAFLACGVTAVIIGSQRE